MNNKINGLRFIIGSDCNFNCFYCHHEGYKSKNNIGFNEEKLNMLYQFAINNKISDISITGGEPFLYWEKLKKILIKFDDKRFKIILNTNISMLHRYIDEINLFRPIEFHINLSSLFFKTHEKITGGKYINQVLRNLDLLKKTNNIICLNIIVLKNYNDREILNLFNYSIENGFKPRFLVFYTEEEELKQNVMDITNIISLFKGAKIIDKYSYGRYDIQFGEERFEIVKCLCDNLECEICKENTYMHITPEFNIKYCMKSIDEIIVDYTSLEAVNKSFKEAQRRLEMI